MPTEMQRALKERRAASDFLAGNDRSDTTKHPNSQHILWPAFQLALDADLENRTPASSALRAVAFEAWREAFLDGAHQ